MLCRTANELYWMARHIERAENTARLLDVTYRTSLLPYQGSEPGLAWAEPWAVPLVTSGLATAFYERHTVLTAENVLRFMMLDSANPSSVYCCLRSARESASKAAICRPSSLCRASRSGSDTRSSAGRVTMGNRVTAPVRSTSVRDRAGRSRSRYLRP